ncbi:Zinc finger protein ZAT1 [Camellia lanceoleosa]|uniref:Zinc finger protein ZAT1 n=1 Tax=Camellia lanceoleosa TaxID=1840588 RepID=A0ACC0G4B1_9ERIC|nr:Zinc finger protein ZAT1 [Camellia lanceoleosa]
MEERRKCKLCSKVFANGRALGGHMRSHLAILPIPPKTEQLSAPSDSASSLSSSDQEQRESEEKALFHGLREKNPKKSPLVQDTESKTELSRNPTRRRSKRTRKMGFAEHQGLKKPNSTDSVAELEPVSSVSDMSPEEDVALSLMMLSRDTWMSSDELRPSRTREKVLRTSHRKVKSCFNGNEDDNCDQRLHECPICYRVFGSDQALGRHKRSHLLISSSSNSAKFGDCLVDKKCGRKFGDCLIDLNMPAPLEDEDFSQHHEVSAVSDPEFINPIKRGHYCSL